MTEGAVLVIQQPDGSQEVVDYELQADFLVTSWRDKEADRQLDSLRRGARFLIRCSDGLLLEPDVQSGIVD